MGIMCICGKAIYNPKSKRCTACQSISRKEGKIRWEKRQKCFYVANEKDRLCLRCNQSPPLKAIVSCEKCWWKSKSQTHFGNVLKAAELKARWELQDRNCLLTGVLLAPPNMELDHKIPLIKEGRSTIDNLQWTLPEANNAKWDLLHDEFLALCRLIVSYADQETPDPIWEKLASQGGRFNRKYNRKKKK